MVKHNHSWKDIKTYTLSEIGIFLRECLKEEHLSTKKRILENWLGTNADGDYIQKHVMNVNNMPLTEKQKKANVQEEAKKAKNQWAKLAQSLG
ncbi:MAG: hypothetical protein DRN17_05395, partial [Thermoplasmata archaeon]